MRTQLYNYWLSDDFGSKDHFVFFNNEADLIDYIKHRHGLVDFGYRLVF